MLFVILYMIVLYVSVLFVACHLLITSINVFFLMIRRPPRSTLDRSSAASDVYKRQAYDESLAQRIREVFFRLDVPFFEKKMFSGICYMAVSYTHLRAHETVLDLVCRLLLEKKKTENLTPRGMRKST